VAPDVAPPPSRALRLWYAVAQAVTLIVFTGLSFIARKFEETFQQMEMRQLPFPTEVCIAVASFIRTLPGLLLVAAAGVTLIVLGLRGRFDPKLRKLIAGNVLATLGLMAFYSLSLYLPIVHIQRAIQKANE